MNDKTLPQIDSNDGIPLNCPMAKQLSIPPSKLKKAIMTFAETVDGLRLVPRLILIGYSYMVFKLYVWYTSMETVVQTKCDATLIQILLENGNTLIKAQDLACTVVDVVGGPTSAQTAFVTILIGLATPLFAFYATTGKKWGKDSTLPSS